MLFSLPHSLPSKYSCRIKLIIWIRRTHPPLLCSTTQCSVLGGHHAHNGFGSVPKCYSIRFQRRKNCVIRCSALLNPRCHYATTTFVDRRGSLYQSSQCRDTIVHGIMSDLHRPSEKRRPSSNATIFLLQCLLQQHHDDFSTVCYGTASSAFMHSATSERRGILCIGAIVHKNQKRSLSSDRKLRPKSIATVYTVSSALQRIRILSEPWQGKVAVTR